MLATFVFISLLSVTTILASPLVTERAPVLAQVIRTCTKPNNVALTFDDGPYLWMDNISQMLVNAGAKGTFFVNGNNWRCIYSTDSVARLKRAYAAGHQIASHTWRHANLTTLSFDQIHDEMWRVEQALERLIGVKPAFMRPPYGSYNNLVREVSAQRGQKVIIWNFDSQDSLHATAAQSKALYDSFFQNHPSTAITINHETFKSTVFDVLPHAISLLKSKGYKLVTVAECLGLNPYQSVGNPQSGSWTC